MGVPGALDWQRQTAQTLRLIDTAALTITTPQAVNVTSLVGPNAQGLVLFWVASLASTGQGVVVQVEDQLNGVSFNTPANLPDGGTLTVPFYGSIFLQGGGHVAQINVSRLVGDPSPLNGTLYVFEATAPVTVIPTIRRDQIGFGVSSGQVTIGASSTTTLLAAPPTGSYYRLKFFTFTTIAAPASANRVQVKGLTSGSILFDFVVTATANQMFTCSLDWQTDDGVSVTNPIASGLPCTMMAEQWRM